VVLLAERRDRTVNLAEAATVRGVCASALGALSVYPGFPPRLQRRGRPGTPYGRVGETMLRNPPEGSFGWRPSGPRTPPEAPRFGDRCVAGRSARRSRRPSLSRSPRRGRCSSRACSGDPRQGQPPHESPALRMIATSRFAVIVSTPDYDDERNFRDAALLFHTARNRRSASVERRFTSVSDCGSPVKDDGRSEPREGVASRFAVFVSNQHRAGHPLLPAYLPTGCVESSRWTMFGRKLRPVSLVALAWAAFGIGCSPESEPAPLPATWYTRCTADDECAPGLVCAAPVLLAKVCTSVCEADKDCPSGFDCEERGVCGNLLWPIGPDGGPRISF
jgi:hypothetical protein